MELNCTDLTERILQLTLEIIYLLTGENNIFAKKTSGDGQESTTVPLSFLLFPGRNNGKKILKVTKKITDLLTGEVFHPSYPTPEGLNINDNKVEYTNEEEEEDVRGDWPCKKEEIKLEWETDGSSNGNPPERCPRPLYSRDSTEEDHTIPNHHQSERWSNVDITIKEEIKEEEKDGVMEDYLEGDRDLYRDAKMETQLHFTSPDGSSNMNPPEGCPCPLYSLDSTQEDYIIPHHHQGEEVIDMKIEVKAEEELYMRDDQPSIKETEMKVKITKQESSLFVSTGEGWNTSEEHLILSRDCNKEDNGMAQYSPEIGLGTQYIHHRFDHVERATDPFNSEESKDKPQTIIPNVQSSCHSVDGSPDPSNPEESSNNLDTCTKRDNEIFPSEFVHNVGNQKVEFPFLCPECGKGFKIKRALHIHQMSHTGKKIYSCPDCKKLYITYCRLVAHRKLHAGEKPYTCFKCEASFGLRSQLTAHQKVHYEQKPFSCSECEKSFMTKQELVHHQRTHTGEKPFPCSECGRSFARMFQLKRHYRVHTGEKPFSCSECHKCFSTKMIRDNHTRVHTGERPYSCPDCSRCFTQKGALTVHQKKHHHTNRDC